MAEGGEDYSSDNDSDVSLSLGSDVDDASDDGRQLYLKCMPKLCTNTCQTIGCRLDVLILCYVTDIDEFEFEDHEDKESRSDDEDDLLKEVPPDIAEESR